LARSLVAVVKMKLVTPCSPGVSDGGSGWAWGGTKYGPAPQDVHPDGRRLVRIFIRNG
jgi:hypothetical protein